MGDKMDFLKKKEWKEKKKPSTQSLVYAFLYVTVYDTK